MLLFAVHQSVVTDTARAEIFSFPRSALTFSKKLGSIYLDRGLLNILHIACHTLKICGNHFDRCQMHFALAVERVFIQIVP